MTLVGCDSCYNVVQVPAYLILDSEDDHTDHDV